VERESAGDFVGAATMNYGQKQIESQEQEVQKQFEDIELQKQIGELIKIANVPPDKMDKAPHDLNGHIYAARKFAGNSREQLNPQKHNDFFDDIEKSARRLIAAIERMDTNGYASLLFWFEWDQHEPVSFRKPQEQVRGTLERIVKAADDSKIGKKGRPRAEWKQILVRCAFSAFESVKSPKLPATQTAEKAFLTFVKTFCDAAEGKNVGSIKRQVEQVAKERKSRPPRK